MQPRTEWHQCHAIGKGNSTRSRTSELSTIVAPRSHCPRAAQVLQRWRMEGEGGHCRIGLDDPSDRPATLALGGPANTPEMITIGRSKALSMALESLFIPYGSHSHLNLPPQPGDHPRRECVVQPERVADCDGLLPDLHAIAERPISRPRLGRC